MRSMLAAHRSTERVLILRSWTDWKVIEGVLEGTRRSKEPMAPSAVPSQNGPCSCVAVAMAENATSPAPLSTTDPHCPWDTSRRRKLPSIEHVTRHEAWYAGHIIPETPLWCTLKRKSPVVLSASRSACHKTTCPISSPHASIMRSSLRGWKTTCDNEQAAALDVTTAGLDASN